ncbi:MAG: TIR domain-containing protein [Anaerolineae bacterium]|nr:TIR domain-containing protein [Anaerolineae bacterium]
MSFSEQWRAQIEQSLIACAKLAAANKEVDLKYELLIVGIFWPVRQPIRDFDFEAIACVNEIAGAQAKLVLRMVQDWGDDPLMVAQELLAQSVRRGEMGKALNPFVIHFDAFTAFAKQLAVQARSAAAPSPAPDPPTPTKPPRVFVFSLKEDAQTLADEIYQRFRTEGIVTWRDLAPLEGERTWWQEVTQALDQVDFLVLAMSRTALTSDLVRRLWRYARQQAVCIYPVFKAGDLDFGLLPRWIRQVHFYNLNLEWPKLLNDVRGTCAIPRIPFMVEDLPPHYVARPVEFEQALGHIFDRERDEGLPSTVALVGASGYGKTMLAAALCHDENIRQVFDNGILWVTLGETPGDLSRYIIDLIEVLSGSRPGFTSLDAALVRFNELLADRDILLVIDDVWNAAHLKPFLQGGNRCARIITTRNAETLPLEVETIKIGPMQRDEAAMVLGYDLPDGYLVERRRLAQRLGEWPLLLRLTNGTLRDRVHNQGDSLPAALRYANQALDSQGLTAFDVAHSAGRRRAVGQTLDLSLGLLNATERVRYNELAIFPSDINIPLAVLEKLWGATGDLDDFDTEELCARFYELSLLAQFDLTRRYIRLHKSMHSYLRFQKIANLVELHQQWLDAYTTPWVDTPQADTYLWTHLFYHLEQAGRTDELLATAKDFRYLINKIKARGVYYAESDLLQAEAITPNDAVLIVLRRTLSQASHMLARCHTLGDIANTLHSRLIHLPEMADILAAAGPHLPRPRLTALCALPDLPDSTLIRTLRGHEAGILACAVSSNGARLVSAGKDGNLFVWDTHSGDKCFQLPITEAEIWDCDISGDGSTVVYALNNGQLGVVDVAAKTVKKRWPAHTVSILSCAINADATVIVTTAKDKTVKVWDAKTGTAQFTFANHQRSVTCCDVSADGGTVASISNDGELKVWDARSGQEHFSAQIRFRSTGLDQLTFLSQRDINFNCTICADGVVVAATSSGGTVTVWDVASGKERMTFTPDKHGANDCALSADGSRLACALSSNVLKVWDTVSTQELAAFADHSRTINSCALTLDGATLISAADDQTLKVWDCRGQTAHLAQAGHQLGANSCTIDANGRVAVSATTDKILHIWNFPEQREIGVLKGHTHKINDCQLCPQGNALVSSSQDQSIIVWDMANLTHHWKLTGHKWSVNGCALNADGTTVVSASDDETLKVWDGHTGAERLTLVGHKRGVNACALSHDGQTLVSASGDSSLILWHPTTGDKVAVLTGHTAWVNNCAISADGATIVSASYDQTLKVWDTRRHQERFTLPGHEMTVTGCAISADGATIVSVSRDKSVKVWNARTGACLTTLFVDEPLLDCACSADASSIIAVSSAGTYFLCYQR